MISTMLFLAGWAIRSATAILVAYGLCAVLISGSAAAKHHIWRCALVATLLIPVAMWVVPSIGPRFNSPLNSVLVNHSPASPEVLAGAGTAKIYETASLPTTGRKTLIEGKSYPGQSTPLVGTLAVVIYLVGFVFALGRWALAYRLIRRICRTGRPMDGIGQIVLASSPDLRVPVTLGWRKALIVLPSDAGDWESVRLEAVIRHEKAHIDRRDWVWQTASTLTTALQWFSPALWLLTANLRSTAEEAADNEVLKSGFAASAYASELLFFASRLTRPNLGAISLTTAGGLKMRLKNILDVHRNRDSADWRASATAAFGFGILGVMLATLFPVQAEAQDSLPRASSAQSNLNGKSSRFTDGVTAQFISASSEQSERSTITWTGNGTDQVTSLTDPKYRRARVHFKIEGFGIGADFQDAFTTRLGGLANDGFEARGDGKILDCRSTFDIPSTWKQATFEIGHGSGLFQEVAEIQNMKKGLHMRVLNSRVSTGTEMRDGSVKQKKYSSTDILFDVPKDASERDWRLQAFDAHGNAVQVIKLHGRPINVNGVEGSMASILASPGVIDRVVLVARDFQWIRFKDIPLIPVPARAKIGSSTGS